MQYKKDQISTFSGGMNMDLDPSLLKSNQYRYAQNVRSIANDSSTTGALTNIEGSTVIEGFELEDGESIIATSTVRDLGIIFTDTSSKRVVRSGTIHVTDADSVKDSASYRFFNSNDGSIAELTGSVESFTRNGSNTIVSCSEIGYADKLLYNKVEIIQLVPAAEYNSRQYSDQYNIGMSGVYDFSFISQTSFSINKELVVGLYDIDLNITSIVKSDSGKLILNVVGDELDIYRFDSGMVAELLSIDGVYDVSTNIYKISNGIYGADIDFIEEDRISVSAKNNILSFAIDNNSISNISRLFGAAGIDLGIPSGSVLSIVSRYEDSDNIKVYWADGTNPIRQVNLKGDYSNVTSANALDILPSSSLTPATIDSLQYGSLKAGTIQYTYQLVTESGLESAIAPLSPVISLTESQMSGGNYKYKGQLKESGNAVNAGRAVRLKIKIDDTNNFSKIKLISVHNHTYGDEPTITVVSSTNIDSSFNGGYAYVTDSGSGAIGELTVSEFNAIGGSLFSAKTIETKNNILFAGNIKEATWDISGYDTRSYQFKNVSGVYKTLLHKQDGASSQIAYSDIATIEIDHDCIHDEIYSKDRYADLEYIYDKDGNLGGSGVNVDYKYINTYFIESYGNYWGDTPGSGTPLTADSKKIDARTARIGDVVRDNLSALSYKKSDGTSGSISLSTFGIPTHSGYINYSNPYLSNNLTSYMRDEIYRFGAVFYDKKGRRSPVKWIADIRIPACYVHNDNFDASHFEMPSEIQNSHYAGTMLNEQELLVKPLGISFSFKNLTSISNVNRIEIVRAKRDLNNKTIYASGVLQQVGRKKAQYTNINDSKEKLTFGPTQETLVPHPVISMSHQYSISPLTTGDDVHMLKTSWSGLTSPFGNYSEQFGYGTMTVNQGDGLSYIYDRNHVSDELSPSRGSRTNTMFISPDISYGGFDFVSQVKSAAPKLSLSLGDIIFPMSTEPGNYIGRGFNDRTVLDDANGYRYPTGMQMAADIHKYNYSPTTGSLADVSYYSGIVGVHPEAIGVSARGLNPLEWKSFREYGAAVLGYIDRLEDFDVYGERNSYPEFPTVPVHICLGGLWNLNYYTSGFDEYGSGDAGVTAKATALPPAAIGDIHTHRLNAITFKYFNKFRFKSDLTNTLVGSTTFIKYNSSSISDTTKYSDSQVWDSGASMFSVDISDIEYSGDLSDSKGINGYTSADYVSCGGSRFLNYNHAINPVYVDNTPAGAWEWSNRYLRAHRSTASGNHGAGAIIELEHGVTLPMIMKLDYWKNRYFTDATYKKTTRHITDFASRALATYITSLRCKNYSIYGGRSYAERNFTEYISTGCIITTDSATKEAITFGGDTFIGLFDYSINRFTDPKINEYKKDALVYPGNSDSGNNGYYAGLLYQRKYIGALIPLESSVNTHLHSGETYITSGNNNLISNEAGVYGPAVNEGISFTSTQQYPQYAYNSAYSVDRTSIGYAEKLIGQEDNKVFDCRVMNSEPKVNDEKSDSWAKFKAANFIDVDTSYGQLSRLKTYNNSLLFMQENAVGSLSVNDRSLISDASGASLVLGTGGVLSRYDYISTNNGFNSSVISGMAAGANGLYWFDKDRNEMCVLGSSVQSVSKAKGLQTFFNYNKNSFTNNIPMIYDKKYDEVITTFKG